MLKISEIKKIFFIMSSSETQKLTFASSHRLERFLFMAQGLVGIVLAVVAYVLEWGHIVQGCQLCQWERALILLGGILSFLAGWIPCRLFFKTIGWMSLPVWISGIFLGLYHAGIQYHLWAQPKMCSALQAENIDEFFAKGALPACSERTFELFGLPGSLYVFGLCGLFAMITFCALKCRPAKKDEKTSSI